jgi:hypothetical protein
VKIESHLQVRSQLNHKGIGRSIKINIPDFSKSGILIFNINARFDLYAMKMVNYAAAYFSRRRHKQAPVTPNNGDFGDMGRLHTEIIFL